MDILALLSLLAIAGLIAWHYLYYTSCQAATPRQPASVISTQTTPTPQPENGQFSSEADKAPSPDEN